MKDYDSTIARMAGNIAAGLVDEYTTEQRLDGTMAVAATKIAIQIVALLKEEFKAAVEKERTRG